VCRSIRIVGSSSRTRRSVRKLQKERVRSLSSLLLGVCHQQSQPFSVASVAFFISGSLSSLRRHSAQSTDMMQCSSSTSGVPSGCFNRQL
jgi:hypothetical protein